LQGRRFDGEVVPPPGSAGTGSASRPQEEGAGDEGAQDAGGEEEPGQSPERELARLGEGRDVRLDLSDERPHVPHDRLHPGKGTARGVTARNRPSTRRAATGPRPPRPSTTATPSRASRAPNPISIQGPTV